MKTTLRNLGCFSVLLLVWGIIECHGNGVADSNLNIQIVNYARGWLVLLDEDKYEQAWSQMSVEFQEMENYKAWTNELRRVREISTNNVRVLDGYDFPFQISEYPRKGIFASAEFITTCNGIIKNEIVQMIADGETWKIVGYALNGGTCPQDSQDQPLNSK